MLRRQFLLGASLANSKWQERVKVLDDAKYIRYDESMATKLGHLSEDALNKYHGDLRNLQEQAQRDTVRERKLVMEFKGIGNVGSAIFCREVQEVWQEVYPFADKKALEPAKKLGLPATAEDLSKWVPRNEFTRLVDALVKVGLDNAYDKMLAKAGSNRK